MALRGISRTQFARHQAILIWSIIVSGHAGKAFFQGIGRPQNFYNIDDKL